MSVFLGLSVSNDTMVECALAPYAKQVRLCTGEAGAWGLAYYSRGELLQRVEPKKQGESLDIAQVTRGMQADHVLVHSRNPTVGTVRSENIHPFRFKDFAFAHNGTVHQFQAIKDKLCESMPPFILRGLKGDTDSEHIFHLFLSFLYDGGVFGRPDPGIELIRDGLLRAVATVDELEKQEGGTPSTGSFIVSDGYSIVALSRGFPIDYVLIEGVRDCGVCRASVRPGETTDVSVDHPNLRAVLVRSDSSSEPPQEGFQRLDEDSFLMVTKSHRVEFSKFE